MTPITLDGYRSSMFTTRFHFRSLLALLLFVGLGAAALAQERSSATADRNMPENSLYNGRGAWDFGLLAGGGSAAGKSSDTQFFFAGGRIGRVLTPDLFRSSPVRGNVEYAIEILPVYTVFTPNGAVYGGSVKPFILRWNFTAPRRVVPYLQFAGGALFTTSNVPPGDTSQINFTPQLGGGIHWFRSEKRSVDFGVDLVHHSNASLGNHNPGYNASVFFSVGYSWYKHSRE